MTKNAITDLLSRQAQGNGTLWDASLLARTAALPVAGSSGRHVPVSALATTRFLWDINPYSASAMDQLHKFVEDPLSQRTIRGNPLLWESFGNIFSQQAFMGATLQNLAGTLPSFPGSQLASLQGVLGELSSKITGSALLNNDLLTLQTFEGLSRKAGKMVQDVADHHHATLDDIKKIQAVFEQGLQEVKEEIIKGRKSPSALIAFWATVISLLLTIFIPLAQAYQTNENNQPATKLQIETLQLTLITKFDSTLKALTRSGTTRVSCSLRLKPTQRSRWLLNVPAGTTVAILSTHHTWVSISLIDPADQMPVSGWVLKKYIDVAQTRPAGISRHRLPPPRNFAKKEIVITIE